ncbi:hypothetical protein ACQYRI_05860 [Salmonella enterica]
MPAISSADRPSGVSHHMHHTSNKDVEQSQIIANINRVQSSTALFFRSAAGIFHDAGYSLTRLVKRYLTSEHQSEYEKERFFEDSGRISEAVEEVINHHMHRASFHTSPPAQRAQHIAILATLLNNAKMAYSDQLPERLSQSQHGLINMHAGNYEQSLDPSFPLQSGEDYYYDDYDPDLAAYRSGDAPMREIKMDDQQRMIYSGWDLIASSDQKENKQQSMMDATPLWMTVTPKEK